MTIHIESISAQIMAMLKQMLALAPDGRHLSDRHLTGAKNVEHFDVPTARLDDVIPDDFVCSFIKIDVEGAEYLVLSGARATLKRYHPTIWFEYGADSAGYFKSTSPQI